MKLSFALSVSTITAASMDEAVGDVPPPWIATSSSEAAAITAQKHRHDHHHHHDHKIETETNGSAVYDRHHVGNNDDQYQKQPPESLPGLVDEMAPAAIAALFDNKEHASIMDSIMDSRSTTTIDSGSGDGLTGDVDVDVGLLPIRERRLNSVKEDCTLCDSSTVIDVSGFDFRRLVSNCFYDYGQKCPDNVPIGCWDTSEVTDMSSAFNRIESFDDSINCWNTARVTDMASVFAFALNFNQPLNDWNVKSVNDMDNMFQDATNFNQPLDDWNVASVTTMKYMFAFASNFNQCLSTWAGKARSDVNLYYMFSSSGCPNRYPDPSVGPWCQGEEDEQCLTDPPTSAPSAPPTSAPSASPTSAPSASPTSAPSASPTSAPSTPPTEVPIAPPTAGPIALPTAGPIALPTAGPTKKQKKTSKKSKK